MVAEGRSLDVELFGGLIYRVDGLGMVLGVAWCVGMALVAWGTGDTARGDKWLGIYLCLMTVGALNVFYARLPFVLYLGWELVGLGLWLALRQKLPSTKHRRELGWVLHASGWPLLLMVLLGLLAPFAPPVGGVAQAWSAPVMLGMAVVVLVRSGCPPFDGWVRGADLGTSRRYGPVLALYAMAAPVVIAKMLVAAPWDVYGAWALALAGTAAVLGSLIVPILWGDGYKAAVYAPVYSAMALVGFALASRAPLAAVGGVALALVGMVSAVVVGRHEAGSRLLFIACILLGAMPGVWLISVGALGLGYGVVAAIMLPVIAGLWFAIRDNEERARDGTLQQEGRQAEGASRTTRTRSYTVFICMAILISVAALPQALVEFVVRPAVGAMAGGVGALSGVRSDWGVGLEVGSAQGVIQAALPATGIAVGVLLVWVALYWLRGLFARFTSTQVAEVEAEAE